MNTSSNNIPAIVADMIGKLRGANPTEADNVALTLESIENAIHREVGIYRRERTKQHRESRDEKRKQRSAKFASNQR